MEKERSLAHETTMVDGRTRRYAPTDQDPLQLVFIYKEDTCNNCQKRNLDYGNNSPGLIRHTRTSTLIRSNAKRSTIVSSVRNLGKYIAYRFEDASSFGGESKRDGEYVPSASHGRVPGKVYARLEENSHSASSWFSRPSALGSRSGRAAPNAEHSRCGCVEAR